MKGLSDNLAQEFRRSYGAVGSIILGLMLGCALGGCGLSAAGTTGGAIQTRSAPLPTIVYPTPTPNAKVGVQTAEVQFCQALSDSNYTQAYGFLTAGYKQRVGSAANLPNALQSTWERPQAAQSLAMADLSPSLVIMRATRCSSS
jgi:hypothetical protein